MALTLDNETTLVRDTAFAFFKEKAPVSALRALRDTRDAHGFSRALWKEMADLGWAGFLVPEEYGGTGFGLMGLGQVLEASGSTLAASPLVSTALIGASALTLGGSAAQKQAWLPRLAAGDLITALAVDDGAVHAPDRTRLAAKRDGQGWRLSGEKRFVLDGHVADLLVVAARTSGQPGDRDGITLFLVPADAHGVRIQRTWMVDSRNAANIHFDGVAVGADAVLGEVDRGFGLLDAILDRARAGLAAEMLGAAKEAFDRTLRYLKERKQFGVLIGSFQALQHRAGQMFCELELTRSAVMQALSAIDEGADDVPMLASLAKAKAGEAFFLVSNEGIQMHGGIGMTDEFEIGFFLKRARVAQASCGDSAFHRDRYAALAGF